MKHVAKEGLKWVLRKFGKRIANYYAPAKPYLEGVGFLKGIIQRPAWIIDVGVADGTKELTKWFPFSEYKYLLLDADEKFLSYMRSVKEQYGEMVQYESCFCGEAEGEVTLHLNKTGHNSSRYSTRGNKGEAKVQMHTLDSITDKYKVEGPVLMKIDVEGAELDVLKGARETLRMCEVVLLESWINEESADTGRDFASVVTFMKTQGFVVFDFFGGHTFKNGVLQHVDVVFVRGDSPYRAMR